MNYRILVIAQEELSGYSAGPGIRAMEMAALLARRHEVRLIAPGGGKGPEGVSCLELSPSLLEDAIREHHIVISPPGFIGLRHLRFFSVPSRFLIYDLVIPSPVEGLYYFNQFKADVGQKGYSASIRRLKRSLAGGDFFLAASEHQRLFWLGALLTNRTVPCNYLSSDPGLKGLVTVAPSGLHAEEKPWNSPGIAGNQAGKRNILWGGGIWPWMDPVSLINAVGMIKERDRINLLFPGLRHPDARVPIPPVLGDLRLTIKKQGLENNVICGEGWFPWNRRSEYLSRADIGVSLHRIGIETRLSWRNRILDYLWAGLPVVLSSGCPLSDLVAETGAGIVVKPGDTNSIARAIENLLFDQERYDLCRKAVLELRVDLDWSRTLSPLVEYCSCPRKAPDSGQAKWYRFLKLVLP